MTTTGPRLLCAACLGLVAAGAMAWSPAAAQTMGSNSASFNTGWGRVPDQENHPVDVGMRDANGNLTVINGVITSGANANAFAGGAGSAFAGAGAGSSSATAIGNNLTVITQGDNNVVVIDSRQVNTGTVTASQSGGSNTHGS